FEVASIRQSQGGQGTFSIEPKTGRLIITNLSLRNIIANVYGIDFLMVRYVLTGGPKAILDATFDIQALPPEGTLRGEESRQQQTQQMLKTLLNDRFALRLHTENKPLPVYELSVLKSGAFGHNLRRSEYDCDAVRAALKADPSAKRPRDSNG